MSQRPDREALFRGWESEYRGIVVKVTRSFARSASEATDLDQEMRLQLWHSTRSFSGTAKPSTWVYRVCLNTALMWRRTITRREEKFSTGTDLASLFADGGSPAEHAANQDSLRKLYEAIHAMPEGDRALILLSLDGLTHREIGEVTGMNENHVGVSLLRARRRLAALMKGIIYE